MSTLSKWMSDKWFVAECALLAGLVGYILVRDRNLKEKRQLHKKLHEFNEEYQERSMPLYRVCITGGPCGGKSSCMKIVRHYFMAKGYNVLCVPETPTMTVLGGASIDINNMSQAQRLQTQHLMIRIQMQIQNYFLRLSRLSRTPTIIFYDRGVMDPCAYISEEQRQAIFNQDGWRVIKMRDDRYDMIIFLVTAADGAEKHYTTCNNLARSEGLEQAKKLDKKTMDVYSAHPHFVSIGNIEGETFQQKIDHSIFAIEDFIHTRSSHIVFKRFLVGSVEFPKEIKHETLNMRIIFLRTEGQGVKEDYIIRRGREDTYIYLRWKRIVDDIGIETYKEQRISARQFIHLTEDKGDKKLCTLNFERTVFIYEKQQFNLDQIIVGPHYVKVLNFHKRKDELSLVKLPNFMAINKDISEDPAYQLLKICEFNSSSV